MGGAPVGATSTGRPNLPRTSLARFGTLRCKISFVGHRTHRVARRDGAIEVRFSSNQGETWDTPFSVAQTSGDRGYPDSVQLANGKIVTVYYAQSTSLYAGYQMAAVVWTPPP